MENLYDEAKVIGARIKNLRLRAGLTQEQLAKNIGVSQGTVAGWECGNSKPSVRVRKKLSDELNVSVETLTSESEGKRIIDDLIKKLKDYDKASREKQKAAEDAVEGDYLVYLANFLIQNADVLAMLQYAGYKINITSKSSAFIQSGPVKSLMTTSDLVDSISKFNKSMEGLVDSFLGIKKEADDDAPQDNP